MHELWNMRRQCLSGTSQLCENKGQYRARRTASQTGMIADAHTRANASTV